jgi:hypothetical protein
MQSLKSRISTFNNNEDFESFAITGLSIFMPSP